MMRAVLSTNSAQILKSSMSKFFVVLLTVYFL